jgi:uncharacterized protein (TIGR03083 family)
MAAGSPWPLIHAERQALAADLATLDDAGWTTPSLCGEWSVRQVLGHMIATAKMTPPMFFAKLAGSGFSFSSMTTKDIQRETAGTPAETLAEFRRLATATSHPPGPADTWLGETIVHGEDIRRPLGITRDYPIAAVVRVADFYKGSNLLIGAKKRIAGLSLRATDAEWSTGDGPEVTGSAISLVLAMTGRAAALGDLSGDGLATLRSRL